MAKEKLTPADKKFIAKFFGEVNFGSELITRSNRFTGETVEVDPVTALMFDFIMKLDQAMQMRTDRAVQSVHPDLKLSNAIMNFDRARMIALKMNSNAYMTLLD